MDLSNEIVYVADTFINNFKQYKDKKIVLYGTGKKTAAILQKAVNFNIVGLMDTANTGGNLMNYKILSPEELSPENVELIIIIASPINFKVIYRKIQKVRKLVQIPVYDYFGNSLNITYREFHKNDQYFEKDLSILKRQILLHDVVVFDFFDVLAMLRLYEFKDIYLLIEKKYPNYFIGWDFVQARIQAENHFKNNLNIDGIYREIKRKYPLEDAAIQVLMSMEEELIRKTLVPRGDVIEAFMHALNLGKQVYIIIDTCMGSDTVLEYFSIVGIFDFHQYAIANKHELTKNRLLKNLKSKNSKSYLYVGSDTKDNMEAAIQNGYDTFPILSAKQMVYKSGFYQILDNQKSLADRIALRLCTSNIFNHSFSLYHTNGKIRVSNAFDLGYTFLGPLVTEFMLWMIESIQKASCDFILFPSRDGFLFYQLYEMMQPYLKPEEGLPFCYFLISRKVGYQAGLMGLQDLKEIIKQDFNGSAATFLKERFDLSDNQIIPIKEAEEENLETYILRHEEAILHKADKVKKGLAAYVDRFGLNGYKKIAMFDFVAYGTCQKGLKQFVDSEMEGFYFMRMLNSDLKKSDIKINSFYKEECHSSADNNFYKNYIFLESIFTSVHPSLRSMEEDGTPIFYEEKRSEECLAAISHIHDGIKSFFLDYLQTAGKLDHKHVSFKVYDGIIGLMGKETTIFEEGVITNLSVYDDYVKKMFMTEEMI